MLNFKTSHESSARRVVAVCSSPFELECLVALLRRDLPASDVFGFTAMEDYAADAAEGDIVVLDLAMPQTAVEGAQRGIATLREARAPISLIVLVSDADDISAAVAAGADCLVSKRSPAVLATAFVATLLTQGDQPPRGERPASGTSALRAAPPTKPPFASAAEDAPALNGFAKRELEVVDKLVCGVSNKQIARTLSLSYNRFSTISGVGGAIAAFGRRITPAVRHVEGQRMRAQESEVSRSVSSSVGIHSTESWDRRTLLKRATLLPLAMLAADLVTRSSLDRIVIRHGWVLLESDLS